MLTDTKAYSGLAVTDLPEAHQFYSETLSLRTSEEYGLKPGTRRGPPSAPCPGVWLVSPG